MANKTDSTAFDSGVGKAIDDMESKFEKVAGEQLGELKGFIGQFTGGGGGSGSGKSAKQLKEDAKTVNQAAKIVKATVKTLKGTAVDINDIITSLNTKQNPANLTQNLKGYFADVETLSKAMQVAYENLQKAEAGSAKYVDAQKELLRISRGLSAAKALASGEDFSQIFTQDLKPEDFNKAMDDIESRFSSLTGASKEMVQAVNDAMSALTNKGGKGGFRLDSFDKFLNTFQLMQSVQDIGALSQVKDVGKKVNYTVPTVEPDEVVPDTKKATKNLDLLYQKLKALHEVKFDMSNVQLSVEETIEAMHMLEDEIDELMDKYSNGGGGMSEKDFTRLLSLNNVLQSLQTTDSKEKNEQKSRQTDINTILKMLDTGKINKDFKQNAFQLDDKGKVLRDKKKGNIALLTENFENQIIQSAEGVMNEIIKTLEARKTIFQSVEVPFSESDYFERIDKGIKTGKTFQYKGLNTDIDSARAYMSAKGFTVDPNDPIFEMYRQQFPDKPLDTQPKSSSKKRSSGGGDENVEISLGIDPEVVEALTKSIEDLTTKVDALKEMIDQIGKSDSMQAINTMISTLAETIGRLPDVFNKDTFDTIEGVIRDLGVLQEKLKEGFNIGESDNLLQYFKDLQQSTSYVASNLGVIKIHLQNLSAITNIDKTALLGVTKEQIDIINGAFSGLRDTLRDVYRLLNEKIKLNPNEIRSFISNITTTQPTKASDQKATRVIAEQEKSTDSAMQQTTTPPPVDSGISGWYEKMQKTVQEGLKIQEQTDKYYQDGRNLVRGLTQGINDESANAVEAVENLADDTNQSFKNKNKINSPSKVWHEYGVFCVQGFIEGLKQTKPELLKEIKDLTDPKSIELGLAKYFQKGGSVDDLKGQFADYMWERVPQGTKRGQSQRKEDVKKATDNYINKVFFEAKTSEQEHRFYQPIDEKEKRVYEGIGVLPIKDLTEQFAKKLNLTSETLENLREALGYIYQNVKEGKEVDFSFMKSFLANDANLRKEIGVTEDGSKDIEGFLKSKSVKFEKDIVGKIKDVINFMLPDQEIIEKEIEVEKPEAETQKEKPTEKKQRKPRKKKPIDNQDQDKQSKLSTSGTSEATAESGRESQGVPVGPTEEDITNLEQTKKKIEVILTSILNTYQNYIKVAKSFSEDNKRLFSFTNFKDKTPLQGIEQTFGLTENNYKEGRRLSGPATEFREYVKMLLGVKKGGEYKGKFGDGTFKDAQNELYSLFSDGSANVFLDKDLKSKTGKVIESMNSSLGLNNVDLSKYKDLKNNNVGSVIKTFVGGKIDQLFASLFKDIITPDTIKTIQEALFNALSTQLISSLNNGQINTGGIIEQTMSSVNINSSSLLGNTTSESSGESTEEVVSTAEQRIEEFKKRAAEFLKANNGSVEGSFMTPYIEALKKDSADLDTIYADFEQKFTERRRKASGIRYNQQAQEKESITQEFEKISVEPNQDEAYYGSLNVQLDDFDSRIKKIRETLGSINTNLLDDELKENINTLNQWTTVFEQKVAEVRQTIIKSWNSSTQNANNKPETPPQTAPESGSSGTVFAPASGRTTPPTPETPRRASSAASDAATDTENAAQRLKDAEDKIAKTVQDILKDLEMLRKGNQQKGDELSSVYMWTDFTKSNPDVPDRLTPENYAKNRFGIGKGNKEGNANFTNYVKGLVGVVKSNKPYTNANNVEITDNPAAEAQKELFGMFSEGSTQLYKIIKTRLAKQVDGIIKAFAENMYPNDENALGTAMYDMGKFYQEQTELYGEYYSKRYPEKATPRISEATKGVSDKVDVNRIVNAFYDALDDVGMDSNDPNQSFTEVDVINTITDAVITELRNQVSSSKPSGSASGTTSRPTTPRRATFSGTSGGTATGSGTPTAPPPSPTTPPSSTPPTPSNGPSDEELEKKRKALEEFKARMEKYLSDEGITVKDGFLKAYIEEAQKDITKINEIFAAFQQNVEQFRQSTPTPGSGSGGPTPSAPSGSSGGTSAPSAPPTPPNPNAPNTPSGSGGGTGGPSPKPPKDDLDKRLARLYGINQRLEKVSNLKGVYFSDWVDIDELEEYVTILESLTDEQKAKLSPNLNVDELKTTIEKIKASQESVLTDRKNPEIKSDQNLLKELYAKDDSIASDLKLISSQVSGMFDSELAKAQTTYVPKIKELFTSIYNDAPNLETVLIGRLRNLLEYLDQIIDKGEKVSNIVPKIVSEARIEETKGFGNDFDIAKEYVDAKKKKKDVTASRIQLFDNAANIRNMVMSHDVKGILDNFDLSQSSEEWNYINELIVRLTKRNDLSLRQNNNLRRNKSQRENDLIALAGGEDKYREIVNQPQSPSDKPPKSKKDPVLSGESNRIILTPTLDADAWEKIINDIRSTKVDFTVVPKAAPNSMNLIKASLDAQKKEQGNVYVDADIRVGDESLAKAGQKLVDEKKAIPVPVVLDTNNLSSQVQSVIDTLDKIDSKKEIKINIVDYDKIPLLTNAAGQVIEAFRGLGDRYQTSNKEGIQWFSDNLEEAKNYAIENSKESGGKVKKANLAFHKPLEIDAQNNPFNSVPFRGQTMLTDKIVDIIKKEGEYDGIIFRNILDGWSKEAMNVFVALNDMAVKHEEIIGGMKSYPNSFEMFDKPVKGTNALDEMLGKTQELKQTLSDINTENINIPVNLDDEQANEDIKTLKDKVENFPPLKVYSELENESLNTLLSDIENKIPKEKKVVIDIQDVQKQKEEADNKAKMSATSELNNFEQQLNAIQENTATFLSETPEVQKGTFKTLDNMIERLTALKEMLSSLSAEGNPFLKVIDALNAATNKRNELDQMMNAPTSQEEAPKEDTQTFKVFEQLREQVAAANELIDDFKDNIASIVNVPYDEADSFFEKFQADTKGTLSEVYKIKTAFEEKIPAALKKMLQDESIALQPLRDGIGGVIDKVGEKTDAFQKEEIAVKKVVENENAALKTLEAQVAKVAGQATGKVGKDAKKNFSMYLDTYKQTGNVDKLRESINSLTGDELYSFYQDEGFEGLKRPETKKRNKPISKYNKNELVEETIDQIKAMYPPSQDQITNIEQQYKRINQIFGKIKDTLKEINDGINSLKDSDLKAFVDNFELLSRPLGEFWTADLSENNILLVIRDILGREGALKDFAKVLSSTDAKIQKSAEKVKKEEFEKKNNVKLNRDGSVNTRVLPWQDWKDAAETYKDELGEILKITEDIKEIKLFNDKGEPILDDDGNQITKQVVVGRTFYGTERTGFERTSINKQGEVEGVRMESMAATPLDKKAQYRKETFNANLDKYIEDAKKAGVYTKELGKEIKKYREELNKATEHNGLDQYAEHVKLLDQKIKDLTKTEKENTSRAKKEAQERYKQDMKQIKDVIDARTKLNKLLAARANPKTAYTVTDEDIEKARKDVQSKTNRNNKIRARLERQQKNGYITDIQRNEALRLLDSDEYKKGSQESLRAIRNIDTKNEMNDYASRYDKAVEAVQDLIQVRADLNKIEADSISNGEASVARRRAEAAERQAEALKKVKDALEDVNTLYKDNNITQKQYDDFMGMFDENQNVVKGKKDAESEDAVTKALVKRYNELERAVVQYENALHRVEDIQDALANGSQVTGRLKSNMTSLDNARKKVEGLYRDVSDLNKKYGNFGGVPGFDNITQRISNVNRSRNRLENNKLGAISKNAGYENAEKGYETLSRNATNYYKILSKLSTASGSVTMNESLFLKKHEEYYKLALSNGQKFNEQLGYEQDKVEELDKAREQFQESNIAAMADVAGGYLDKVGSKLQEAMDTPLEKQTNAFKEQSQEVYKQYLKLQEDISNIDWNKKPQEKFETMIKQIQEFEKNVKSLGSDAQYNVVNEVQKEALGRKMSEWQANNTAAYEYIKQIEVLKQQLSTIDDQGALNKISAEFEKLKGQAFAAGEAGLSFGDKLKGSMGNLARYLMSFASFYRIIGTIRQGIGIVKELDSALVEMSKTSDATRRTLKAYQKETFTMAETLGTTSVQIQQSTADWTRLGFSLENASKMAQLAIKLMNVSEFTNVTDATQALISATQAYKDVAPEDMVSKLNLIGNNFSVATDDLARGLQNAAAVLVSQGNSFDEALGLLTSGNSITQDISKTSAGIRTISLRIAGTEQAKEDLAEIDGDVDDFVVRTKSKTDEIIRNYTAVASNAYKGVSVLDSNGNLRSTYDINIMCPHMRNLCA